MFSSQDHFYFFLIPLQWSANLKNLEFPWFFGKRETANFFHAFLKIFVTGKNWKKLWSKTTKLKSCAIFFFWGGGGALKWTYIYLYLLHVKADAVRSNIPSLARIKLDMVPFSAFFVYLPQSSLCYLYRFNRPVKVWYQRLRFVINSEFCHWYCNPFLFTHVIETTAPILNSFKHDLVDNW